MVYDSWMFAQEIAFGDGCKGYWLAFVCELGRNNLVTRLQVASGENDDEVGLLWIRTGWAPQVEVMNLSKAKSDGIRRELALVLCVYLFVLLFFVLQDPLINSPFQIAGFGPRLHPLSFGEGVEVDPLPPKEIRYTSSVKYDSDRHYIDNVFLQHSLGVGSCSQTVVCVPDCTWRNYKTELKFEMQRKPQRFLSAVIVYPKYAKTVYTTTVDYNCRKAVRRFLSSVELEVTDCIKPSSPTLCFP
ncbi:refilin-B-like [Leucoraja erinacea]|uniref:refilin-B-like n=1 Tax=Leucoraja erinaceus TaxID=7782 RepID=UPI00245720BF|nr:refilin-B-like [Leucoraja erinacea]